MVTFLSGFREVLVARVRGSIHHDYRTPSFNNKAGQSLVDSHGDAPDSTVIQPLRRAEHEPFASVVEQVNGAHLRLHPLGHDGHDAVQRSLQIFLIAAGQE